MLSRIRTPSRAGTGGAGWDGGRVQGRDDARAGQVQQHLAHQLQRATLQGFDASLCHVPQVLVAQKVTAGVYKGVTTSELDELAAETAAAMTATHPDYALVSEIDLTD